MNTGDILIYQNSEGSIKNDVCNGNYWLNCFAIYPNVLIIGFQSLTALLTIICENKFANSKNCHTFDTNNTCHASHKNSAPGQVFAFYRLLVFNPLNTKVYALQ